MHVAECQCASIVHTYEASGSWGSFVRTVDVRMSLRRLAAASPFQRFHCKFKPRPSYLRPTCTIGFTSPSLKVQLGYSFLGFKSPLSLSTMLEKTRNLRGDGSQRQLRPLCLGLYSIPQSVRLHGRAVGFTRWRDNGVSPHPPTASM